MVIVKFVLNIFLSLRSKSTMTLPFYTISGVYTFSFGWFSDLGPVNYIKANKQTNKLLTVSFYFFYQGSFCLWLVLYFSWSFFAHTFSTSYSVVWNHSPSLNSHSNGVVKESDERALWFSQKGYPLFGGRVVHFLDCQGLQEADITCVWLVISDNLHVLLNKPY